MDLTGRINLVRSLKESKSKDVPIQIACKLLNINRSTVYYKEETSFHIPLEVKKAIDFIHVHNPSYGFRQITKILQSHGFNISEYKTKCYMNEMAIHAVYPLTQLSNFIDVNYPFLLHNVDITRSNQVWSIGISFICLENSFAFLTIIIDWYSLYIIDWNINTLLTTKTIIKTLSKSFDMTVPDIINSDQGNIFKTLDYINLVKSKNIKISMNNKYQWCDNIMTTWFRDLKLNEVYQNNYINLSDARKNIGKYIKNYNNNSDHLKGLESPKNIFFAQ